MGFKQLEPAYGFDDVSISPGIETINPDMTDLSFSIGENTEHKFQIPFIIELFAITCLLLPQKLKLSPQ